MSPVPAAHPGLLILLLVAKLLELLAHRRDPHPAAGRLDLQAAGQQGLQPWMGIRAEAAQGRDLEAELLQGGPGHRPVEGGPQRVDVPAQVAVELGVLLGRREARADHRERAGVLTGRQVAGHSEVDHLDLAVIGDHHVGRLEIPQHDRVGIARVEITKDLAELKAPVHHLVLGGRALDMNLLVHGLAGDPLHHQVVPTLLGEKLDHVGKAGVLQAHQEGRLLEELGVHLPELLLGEAFRRDLLDGHQVALPLGVPRQVDRREAAPAQRAEDPVAPVEKRASLQGDADHGQPSRARVDLVGEAPDLDVPGAWNPVLGRSFISSPFQSPLGAILHPTGRHLPEPAKDLAWMRRNRRALQTPGGAP